MAQWPMLFEGELRPIGFVLETILHLPHVKAVITMLILPKPAKDEFALGLIGRICHVNSVKSYSEIMQRLVGHFGLKSENARLKALALSVNMELQDFVSSHTVAPALITDWNKVEEQLSGNGECGRHFQRFLLNPARLHASFCPKCVDQQRHDLGYPFWHRAHQMPGIYRCPWHQTVLLDDHFMVGDRELPLTDSVERGIVPAEKRVRNPTLQLFGSIMMDGLAHPGRYSKPEFVACLRNRAIERGLVVDDESSHGRRLSDLATLACPRWWLHDVFGLHWNVKGHFSPINGALSLEPVRPSAYALAIALLFAPDEWASLGIETWTMN